MTGGGSTLAVLQPGYLPWLGFFDQLFRADVFVFYDDVQFDKNGWRNRNRIKAPDGPRWLTVPVLLSGLNLPPINQVRIDNRMPWARRHIGTIRQFYAKAPYLTRYLPELEELLNQPWERLVDLDIALAKRLCAWLGLERRLELSSELGITGERSGRLLDMCRHLGAARYLSGNAARAYLDVEMFAAAGVEVEWQDYNHPVYPQLHGEFVPYLSCLDLLLNAGDESLAILCGRTQLT